MLVLSRKVDERIIIGENIRLTVVSIRGNKVRIGIEAPENVSVFREELIRNTQAGEPAGQPLCSCLAGKAMVGIGH